MSSVIGLDGLGTLIDVLREHGWTVIGPTVRDGAVVQDEVQGLDDLPLGIGDEQGPGRYRLHRRADRGVFGHVVGPQSYKNHLFPSRRLLWRGRRTDDGLELEPGPDRPAAKIALLGIRSCDLHALAISDRVLGDRTLADADYQARRQDLFTVTVACAHPGGSCFCTSMGTGPRADGGYDLALTELLDPDDPDGPDGHRFLVQAGSGPGEQVLAEVLAAAPGRPAGPDDQAAADEQARLAAGAMGRTMPAEGLRDLLYANAEHPRWDQVASRCLTCGSCTQVCPTCFCTSVADVTDLTGDRTERWRVWDSCFTEDFSYLHGGSVRTSARSRYRQWMTHKLAAWEDQFGSSGCVGCGRCLTWCPVGIDITEEVAAIRADPAPAGPGPGPAERR